MSTTDPDALPSAWQAYLPLVTSLVRSVLGVLGGAGFTWALTVNDSQLQMIVSALMVLAAAVWSFYQKLQAQRALREAAVAPASAPAPHLPA
jgi:ABC-type nickel/cobalt efflux system permease component RcnA